MHGYVNPLACLRVDSSGLKYYWCFLHEMLVSLQELRGSPVCSYHWYPPNFYCIIKVGYMSILHVDADICTHFVVFDWRIFAWTISVNGGDCAGEYKSPPWPSAKSPPFTLVVSAEISFWHDSQASVIFPTLLWFVLISLILTLCLYLHKFRLTNSFFFNIAQIKKFK